MHVFTESESLLPLLPLRPLPLPLPILMQLQLQLQLQLQPHYHVYLVYIPTTGYMNSGLHSKHVNLGVLNCQSSLMHQATTASYLKV